MVITKVNGSQKSKTKPTSANGLNRLKAETAWMKKALDLNYPYKFLD